MNPNIVKYCQVLLAQSVEDEPCKQGNPGSNLTGMVVPCARGSRHATKST